VQKDQKIITFVGSGFKRKGVEEFLHIISKLKYKNFKAFIIGKEKKINFYKKLAVELGVSRDVVFTGPRSDVNDFYAVSDIFLFPSRYDPFGNVILEAMHFSNAVITTQQCGAGEILDDEFIMKQADDYTIVDQITMLMEDQDKSYRLLRIFNRWYLKTATLKFSFVYS